MYIHEEILLAVLPLMEKHDIGLLDLIGEMNHAAWELTPLSPAGIRALRGELENAKNFCPGTGKARDAS